MNMSLDTIRAWKDEDYRASLNADQLARLGENPAGQVELTDEELDSVDGAITPILISAAVSAAVSATVALSIERCWVMF